MNVNFDGQLFAIADMGRIMCNGVEALQRRIGFSPPWLLQRTFVLDIVNNRLDYDKM